MKRVKRFPIVLEYAAKELLERYEEEERISRQRIEFTSISAADICTDGTFIFTNGSFSIVFNPLSDFSCSLHRDCLRSVTCLHPFVAQLGVTLLCPSLGLSKLHEMWLDIFLPTVC